MFKKIISPIQVWLLSQGKCVGCGALLEKGKTVDKKDGDKKITCKCGRIYIFDNKEKSYRRALFEEV